MRTTILSIIMLMALSFSVLAQNVGDIAPDFSLTDLDGNTVTLNQHKGKVVALFIFGYACSPCMAIAPDIQSKIHEEYGSTGNFVLLGLDQWDGNKAAVESFRTQTKVTFPLLQKASATATSYKSTWDRLIVIDQEGKIAFKGTNLAATDLNAAINTINGLLTTTSIQDIQSGFDVETFPNPVASVLNIRLNKVEKEAVAISLKGIDGKTVRSFENTPTYENENLYLLNLEGISQGIYFLDVKVGEKERLVKIVKQ